MSLREVQVFLTSYLRDQSFRATHRDGELDQLATLNLTNHERSLVEQIKLDHLDKVAGNVLSERFDRAISVFGLFFDHLARFTDVDAFYQEFDRQHTRGWWQRRAEIRRLEAFVLDIVAERGLPDYLVDLCRLCSHITVVAESPKSASPKHADLPGITVVRGYHLVALRQPFDVVRFRYDVIRALDDPDWSGHTASPTSTELLIQRDWRQHKRSRILVLSEHPVLRALTEGPATVFALGARLPELSYSALLYSVAELFSEEVVHLVVPQEVTSDLVPSER